MSIYEQQIFGGRLHRRTARYRQHLDEAATGIQQMLAVSPKSYVSVSFGKQSVVLAHMLYQVAPQIPMRFLASSESWWMYDFASVIEAFTARWPIQLEIVQTERFDDGLDWASSRKAGRGDLQCLSDGDWTGWFWGLAKEESARRRMVLSQRQGQPPDLLPSVYQYRSGQWQGKYRCCPLMNWQLLDLAAYISEFDLPLLSIYKELGLQQRTTARLTGTAADRGSLDRLKQHNKSAYNRLCEQFPELRSHNANHP